MECSDNDKTVDNQNKLPNGFKEITKSPFIWLEHITSVDLSNKKLSTIEDNVIFPQNLVELILSHNKLTTMPTVVLNHEKLKMLDLSYNELEYFDETPNFCHSIEILNLCHNCLLGPPYWVWSESPAKLKNLDLSFNIKLTDAFHMNNLYFKELLSYKSPLVSLKINNCSIQKHWKLLCTFFKLRVLELGSDMLTRVSVNTVTDIPCEGLENCCDIQSLNLSNTHVYNIKHNIKLFSCLVEINLSYNYINGLPDEFCNLINLETCILSSNNLLYLPDDIGKLKKLVKLSVDNNELCMLPDSITELKNLEYLDVYNNCLYEIPEVWKQVAEIDCSQNYLDEPHNSEYIEKKEKLRSTKLDRFDFRKIEVEQPDSEHSVDTSLCSISSINSNPEMQKYDLSSSPEDWDSDKYWVPGFSGPTTNVPQNPWLEFVKRKMSEGNFCPMDIHSVSIAEKVKYDKLCNNKIVYESDGQFDDFSDDNS